MLKIVFSLGLALAILFGTARTLLAAGQGEQSSENAPATWQWLEQSRWRASPALGHQQTQAQEQVRSEATLQNQLQERDRLQEQGRLQLQDLIRESSAADTCVAGRTAKSKVVDWATAIEPALGWSPPCKLTAQLEDLIAFTRTTRTARRCVTMSQTEMERPPILVTR